MHIVTAGVHYAWDLRGIGNLIGLLDRQGIHVGPESNPRACFTQITHDTRLSHAGADPDPENVESIGNLLGRPMLSKGQLGMAMKVAAGFYQYFTQLLSSLEH